MDSAKFEGLLYNTFSENSVNNQRIKTKNSEYDFTISDDLSQHYGIQIG